MYLDGSRKQIIARVVEGVAEARIEERLRVTHNTIR